MIRPATRDECEGLVLPNFADHHVFVCDEGCVVARAVLSVIGGNIFGHDMESWSSDKTVALRMWKHLEKKAEELGFNKSDILIHMPPNDPLEEFWKKRGFELQFGVYRRNNG